MLIANAIMNLNINRDCLEKLRDEIKSHNPDFADKKLSELGLQEWKKIVDFEKLGSYQYNSYVISESLRLDPSVKVSTGFCMSDNVKIKDVNITPTQVCFINIYALQRNPDEWKEPNKFIPERFNPSSEWYLTPRGTKRHPMSYGPFLGGKRICLGKTFAENIGKLIVCMVSAQMNFDFTNKEYYKKKPENDISMPEPQFTMNVTIV